jgi:hypothetical protein
MVLSFLMRIGRAILQRRQSKLDKIVTLKLQLMSMLLLET